MKFFNKFKAQKILDGLLIFYFIYTFNYIFLLLFFKYYIFVICSLILISPILSVYIFKAKMQEILKLLEKQDVKYVEITYKLAFLYFLFSFLYIFIFIFYKCYFFAICSFGLIVPMLIPILFRSKVQAFKKRLEKEQEEERNKKK
jgi:hypothetical protein